MDSVPRSNRLFLNVPAEIKIREAINEVERLGADITITEAVTDLYRALSRVSNYVDIKLKS